jgi:hypothetical protein
MNPNRRNAVGRIGYILVGCSIATAAALWYWTCGMGGYHCFDGPAGKVVAGAQYGILAGIVCSFFGRGPQRVLFVLLGLAELVACFLQGMVH